MCLAHECARVNCRLLVERIDLGFLEHIPGEDHSLI